MTTLQKSNRWTKWTFGLPRVIVLLGFVSLFTDLSSEMIIPVLPIFLTTVLHVQAGAIGLIEGIAESTASILKLFSGWFSDRLGRRKPLMLIGYGLSNFVKPLFALTMSWGQVLTIRFADRFGKGIRGAPRDALIADVTKPAERGKAFGFHRAMDTLGAAMGPLVSFAILSAMVGNYRLVFYISAIPGFLAVMLLVFFLKEKRNDSLTKNQTKRPAIALLHMDKLLFRYTLIATLFALGNSSDAFLILKAQHVGMSIATIPLVYFVFNMVYSGAAVPAGILSDKIGRRSILIVGYLLFSVIYLGFAFSLHAWSIWVLFIAYGLYNAATQGIQKAYVTDLVPAEKRGTAIGTFNAFTGFAALPASLLAGLLWQHFGPQSAFELSSILSALAALLLILLKI